MRAHLCRVTKASDLRAGVAAVRDEACGTKMEAGMTKRTLDFDAPDLAARLERLPEADIDALPFGVVRLDRNFNVLIYSKTEARLSGFGRQPVGEYFFGVARKLGSENFRGRIEQAMADGKVDLDIGWVGDFDNARRDLRIRVQSASDGGVWMCIDRDPRNGGAAH